MSNITLFRRALAIVAATTLTPVSGWAQQTHVVPLSELQATLVAVAQHRQENISRLERFFTGDSAENALQGARLNGSQIRTAIAMLNDQELARLAARAEKANSDFAAGSLTNQELTYIVIALGTAVLILVIVAAR
jgi:CHASE3 domain sensor protein